MDAILNENAEILVLSACDISNSKSEDDFWAFGQAVFALYRVLLYTY